MDEEKIDIDIAGLAACRGGVQADTPSDDLRQAVQVPAFQVDINLNRGEFPIRCIPRICLRNMWISTVPSMHTGTRRKRTA